MNALNRDILRFGVVGTIGFLIDSLILSYLVSVQGWDPFLQSHDIWPTRKP